MEKEQILYVDSSYQTNSLPGAYSEKVKLCLNYQINNGVQGCMYSIRISLQNPSDPDPVFIGFSNPQGIDSAQRVLVNLSFIIDYYFQMKQILYIEVLKNQETFKLTTTVGEIIGAIGSSVSLPLYQNSPEILIASGVSIKGDDEMLSIDVSIPNGSGDIFFVFKKVKPGSETKEYFAVYKSEISSKQFKQVNIASSYLNYGNDNSPIAIDLYAYNSVNGTYETSVTEILNGKFSFMIGDFNMSLLLKKEKREKKTFMQYLKLNLQLNLEIAIDFTGSNGAITSSNSLHYLGTKQNLYELAIRECGDIIAAYDSDKIFPVYGFGAAIGTSKVSHCFPLNLTNDPNIPGIDLVLSTYRKVVPQLKFSGPTNFTPFFKAISEQIKKTMNFGFNYNILLILTDGVITDLDDTVDAIVEASYLPISIIIVGIGNSDFTNMNLLDGDKKALKSKKTGKTANRDIVQFVPFRECLNNPQLLAMKVLEELPTQVENYFNALKK